ncbi:hypothetical protein [Sabulibacter ruber]|uniref:hypothetical protein n=1 Tax=Sabulibacter ruber TaxID=2811901 RepID=UPI001A967DB8|nr:hypothetical protein [Sabulibacter ruber]
MKEAQLVFVYNANADLFSTVTDFAHKLLSPQTYPCQLCALTYGNFTEKQAWKTFVQHLPIPSVFLHKDEFAKKYRLDTRLPAVFLQQDGTLEEIISKSELENCSSLEALQDLVRSNLKRHA